MKSATYAHVAKWGNYTHIMMSHRYPQKHRGGIRIRMNTNSTDITDAYVCVSLLYALRPNDNRHKQVGNNTIK